VPARTIEVHAAPSIVGIDLRCEVVAGIGPVGETTLHEAAEDLVELVLAHEEGVVLQIARSAPAIVGQA
jgi:hypothetical protein